jgi:TfoX/Sxy family transcriptional regulator of competence genes
MKWKKSPESLVALFGEVLPDDASVERRSMFGYPCAFVHGQMFCGLHQEDLVLRLPPAERAKFLEQPGAEPFVPMPGRPMTEYVVAPPALLESRARLGKWLEKSLAYASKLPPKTRPKRAKAAAARAPKQRTRRL